MTSAPHLYFVAGEPSGDRLGASLIAALRTLAPEVRVSGVGGTAMASEGLDSLFDTSDLSVMGIAEVLPSLRTILRRMRETERDVLARRPDALITIDAPSFGLRVAERVRAKAPEIRTIHYVAPSVWAWRPGRARHMARFIDHVLALLPFEPPYMEAAGMSCDFVGHPIASLPPPDPAEVSAIRAELGAAPAREGDGLAGRRPLLLMAPGSRRGEVRRLWPIFADVAGRLRADFPDLQVVVPVAETVEREVTAAARALEPAPRLILPAAGEAAKRTAFAAADAALVASGTVTLELAAADTPHVAAYRTSWATAAVARRLLRVDTANLVNLVAGGRPIPEFIQETCRPDRISTAVATLLRDPAAQAAQSRAYEVALTALGREGEAPGLRAARSVLRVLG